MNRQTRGGFTLVELLVVITIIGMLVALLFPAVGAIREQARLTQCKNNHHQLHLAAASYEASRGEYPSYFFEFEPDEGDVNKASWVVALLPNLGENALHKRWVEKGQRQSAYLKFMVCPSNPPETTEGSPANYKANLLVLRESRPYSSEQVNSGDGAQYTLLISEGVKNGSEHHQWDLDEPGEIRGQLCFTTEMYFKTEDYYDDDSSNKDKGTPMKSHLDSKHSAGIVVAMCSGTIRTISDDISNKVYQALVTPDNGEPLDEDMIK